MLGIIGNLLTIIAVAKCRFLQQKRNVLIVSLAISDMILVSMFVVDMLGTPFDRLYTFKISLSFIMLSYAEFTSATHLVFIGIERVIAIMWPLHHPRIVTEKTLASAVVIAWLTPAVSCVPAFVYVIETTDSYQGHVQLLDIFYGLCLASYCIFAIALCGIYGKIYRDARFQVNRVQAFTGNNHNTNSGNNKAIKLVLVILLAFLVSDFLYVVYGTLKLCGVDPDGVNPYLLMLEAVSFVFVQANAVVNAAVYAVFSRQFRRAYGIVLCFCKHDHHAREGITESISL
jgi:hypothetical protein